MSSSWLAFLLVSVFTGNPLFGALAALVVLWGAEGWFRGRMWTPMRWFRRYERIRRLRDDIAANPHDATAKGQLGGLLVDSRPAEARALLEEVTARYPDQALEVFHLGAARLNLGDTDGGRTAIEHALAVKKDVGYGEPMIRLGDHLAARERWAEAIACYERALKVHRSSAEARYKLGLALARSGDVAGATATWALLEREARAAPPFKRRVDRPWRIRAWLRAKLAR